MIVLRKSIRIRAQPEAFMDFMANLERSYPTISKDHLRFSCIEGDPVTVGSICENEEYFMGRQISARYRVAEVIPNQRIVYEAIFPTSIIGGRIIHEITPQKKGFLLTQIIEMGQNWPLLGRAWNTMLRFLMRRRLEPLRAHQIEGLEQVKTLLERQEQAKPPSSDQGQGQD